MGSPLSGEQQKRERRYPLSSGVVGDIQTSSQQPVFTYQRDHAPALFSLMTVPPTTININTTLILCAQIRIPRWVWTTSVRLATEQSTSTMEGTDIQVGSIGKLGKVPAFTEARSEVRTSQ